MAAVALAAIALGGWLQLASLARVASSRRRDAASYAASEALGRTYARRYAQRAQESRRLAESCKPCNPVFLQDLKTAESRDEAMASRYRRNADYWAMMHKKYERAARTPWSAVAPDPPPPM